jgi:hypothetical protein
VVPPGVGVDVGAGLAVEVGAPVGVGVAMGVEVAVPVEIVFWMFNASDALPSTTEPGFTLWLVTSMV